MIDRFARRPWIAVTLLLIGSVAQGAQLATVEIDKAELRIAPSKVARVVDRLPKGAVVTAANLPIEGFYKVRTGGGTIGWMAGDTLTLQGPPPGQPTLPGFNGSQKGTKTGASPQTFSEKRSLLKVLGGLSLFHASEIEDLTQITGLSNGFYFGAEYSYSIVPEFSLVFRLERLSKELVGNETSTGKVFDMAVSTIPLSVGLDYLLLEDRDFRSSVGLLLGFGLGTQLTSTGVNYDAPNVTTLSGTAFSGLLRFDFHYRFSESVSGFAEAGYRLLKTGQLVPAADANGSEIFASNGEYVPVAINLSGGVLGLGVAFAF